MTRRNLIVTGRSLVVTGRNLIVTGPRLHRDRTQPRRDRTQPHHDFSKLRAESAISGISGLGRISYHIGCDTTLAVALPWQSYHLDCGTITGDGTEHTAGDGTEHTTVNGTEHTAGNGTEHATRIEASSDTDVHVIRHTWV